MADTQPDSREPLLLEQQVRYSYDRPVHHLRHRLVVIPRPAHGTQLRRDFGISVSEESAELHLTTDPFSNCVAWVEASRVTEIEFSAWAVVTRQEASHSPERWSATESQRLLRATHLTHATGEIARIAKQMTEASSNHAAIGEMACRWTSQAIDYGFGATDVSTTAAAALAGGIGVCQDYAHIMLAVCRSARVPARYVSGHLTGEGGSHAWVEVLQADPSGGWATAFGFDPTHDRPVDDRYLTVAVGRDYSDVAPTSGTFRGRAQGDLQIRKVVRQIEADDLVNGQLRPRGAASVHAPRGPLVSAGGPATIAN